MSSQWLNSKPPNAEQTPIVGSILRDFSAEALGELRTWLEQNPPAITVQSIIGYQTNTVRVYKKSTAALDVANTTTETAVFDEMIPAGSMSTTGIVRVTVLGDYLNSTGGAVNVTLKVKFGGTTIFNSTVGPSSSASRGPAGVEFSIANLGATNVNFLNGLWTYSATRGAETVGISTASIEAFASNGTTAIDTSVTQSLQVTIQHASASASVSWRRQFYMIEFL